MIVCNAYAKVNLVLQVLWRRPDGFHEVASVLQTIDLHDVVRVGPGAELAFSCSDASLATPDNLALRAARLLRERKGVQRGATIHLEKHVPAAAGLGGGSSDAAATLLALAQLWGLRLAEAERDELAAALGSDVPFFLRGGTALATGRGEHVESLPAAPERWLVLLRPRIRLANKTAVLYRSLSPAHFDDGSAVAAAVAEIRAGRFPADELLANTFEKVADEVFAGLQAARARFRAAARGRAVHLAGAGPTLFAHFAARGEAEQVLATLAVQGEEVYLARSGEWRPQPVMLDN